MSGAIVRTETPEEREYARYLGEIETRKRKVAELQADLQLLKEQLGAFNATYHMRVGILLVELDKVRLAIDEYECRVVMLQRDPEMPPEDLEREVHNQFSKKHDEVHEDEEETRRYERTYREAQQRPELDEHSESKLKSLYRELAKRFHPDLARTDAERQQREAMMKQVNTAFHARDIEALETIGVEMVFTDPTFDARSIGEKLVWAIREVSRLDRLIESIIEERKQLVTGDLAQLWQRHEAGEDIIERLEHAVLQDLEHAQRHLQEVIKHFQHITNEIALSR